MSVAASPDEAGIRRVRIGGVRKFIAERMRESLAHAAQLTFHGEADLTRLLELRAGWKATGVPIGVEDCLIVALARALAEQPEINGTSDDEAVTIHDAIHVAIAIAAPDGLKTPVLRDVGSKSLLVLAQERRDLIDRALAKKLQVSEMKGGTVTLSNLGNSRVHFFTPILNGGQLALLGVGCPEVRPAFAADGAVVARSHLGLSLTVDHRIVDGEPAARLLTAICRHIEEFSEEG